MFRYICVHMYIYIYSERYVSIYMPVSRLLKTEAPRRTITERTLEIHALGHTAAVSSV